MSPPSTEDQWQGIENERKIREQTCRPQLPHGDYVGMMDELAHDLNLYRQPTHDGEPQIVTPFAYRSHSSLSGHDGDGDDESRQRQSPHLSMTESLKNFVLECKHGGYLRSRVAFLNMIGHWNFTREIQNFYDPSQSGHVIGTSSFLPAHDLSSSHSVLDGVKYREEGIFTLTRRHGNNLSFSIQREDFYSYHSAEDTIQIHFIKNSRKENHFLTLRFHQHNNSNNNDDPVTADTADGDAAAGGVPDWWKAESDHWCSPDSYSAVYRFRFHRIHLEEIQIEMKCKGPFKDYVTQTIYTRPRPASRSSS
jgi:hypothetical protein